MDLWFFFFFQAEDGIRDIGVTGVQTCALPILGHDIEAAAAMGQVKTLVRGIAFDRLEEPAGVLRRVDHALVGLAVPAMATALVCRIEQTTDERAAGVRRLRWSTAGHPDPMMLRPDGTAGDLVAPV